MHTTNCESKRGSLRVVGDLVSESINLTWIGPSVNRLNPYVQKS
jgi:hypothetical protein